MSLFGKKPDPTPPPTPDPEVTELKKSVSDLASTVQSFVAAQSRPPPEPEEPLVPQGSFALPEAPPITDVSDDELEEALEEGGARARKAMQLRSKADRERMQRDTDAKIAAVSFQGTRAINDTTVKLALQDAPHYHKNPAIKADVDKHIKQLANQGILLDANAIQWLYKKAVGDHAETLMDNAREEAVRKLREPEDLTARGGGGRGIAAPRGSVQAGADSGVPQPQDLTPDAEQLLASRNRGRGVSADEFARSLPPHRYYDYQQRKHVTRRYDSWNDYMEKYQEAQDIATQQHEMYFGRN